MSRFARLQSAPILTWAPPESPLKIEYSAALLREVRMASGDADAFGLLYGFRRGQTIRLIATRGRAGLDPVGIFASRVRGKVFLTEEDLERFEKNEAGVALVLSGDHAGFFVPDAQGSIETVCSYEEFFVSGPPVAKAPKRKWPWAIVLPLLALFFYRPQHRQLALTLHENAGQLQISWNVPAEATLSIIDGRERTDIAIHRDQSTATYARRSQDVSVAIGAAKARFIGAPSEIELVRAGIEKLQLKIAELQSRHASGEARIAELRRHLQ